MTYSIRCEEFARRGVYEFKVYASSRNLYSMNGLAGETLGIQILEVDVTSDQSVKNAIDAVIEKEGRIDILVNNAGVICADEYSFTLWI